MIVALPNSADLVAVFWAIQLIGATAVLVPEERKATPVDARRGAFARIAAIVEPAVIVAADKGIHPTDTSIAVLAPAADGPAPLRDWPDPPSDGLAVIQFTSGSTAEPKGCALSHRAMAENAAALVDSCDVRPHDTGIAWLPLHHDMGLMSGVVVPVVGHAASRLSPPKRFLANPLSWLCELGAFQRTHTAVPNFALALSLRRLKGRVAEVEGLENVASLMCGAEPIDAALVTEFFDAFGPRGLSPRAFHAAYGMSETTVLATSRPGGLAIDRVEGESLRAFGVARPAPDSSDAVSIVNLGKAPRGGAVRIIADSGRLCKEREVGHVQLRAASMMTCYFGDPAATHTAFQNDWLKTGDLGYLAEGDLFITGRAKEMIIVAGRNIAPSDIENAVAQRTGIPMVRIVAIGARQRSSGTETIHLHIEVRSPVDPASLRADIQRACFDACGVAPAVVQFVPPGTIGRTTSGKKQRHTMMQNEIQ